MQAGIPTPPGRCFAGRFRAAWRGFERLSRGMRGGEGGVGGEPVSVPRQPFSVGLATSIARQAAPAAANTNEPMLRKENVPACISHQATRRSECESRNTNHGFFRVLPPSGGEKCRLEPGLGRTGYSAGGFRTPLHLCFQRFAFISNRGSVPGMTHSTEKRRPNAW